MTINNFFTTTNVLILMVLIIGIVWLVYGLLANRRINMASTWPRVDARILSFGTWGGDNQYRPIVLYQYNINGTTYQSNRVYYANPQTMNQREIESLKSIMHVNNIISVHYNPAKPQDSYIYIGEKSNSKIYWSLLLILIAVLWGIWANKTHWHNSNANNVNSVNANANSANDAKIATSDAFLSETPKSTLRQYKISRLH